MHLGHNTVVICTQLNKATDHPDNISFLRSSSRPSPIPTPGHESYIFTSRPTTPVRLRTPNLSPFVCLQVNLDRFNASVCVGSCGVYRRTAVEPFGGVAPIEHSEDMYTGFKMSEIGFKVRRALTVLVAPI